ncbi:hypothetical protein HDC90_001991 [Pedobacter sp. AK013]|nr:hypothetical protein [Pedobacter sp. AK013]
MLKVSHYSCVGGELDTLLLLWNRSIILILLKDLFRYYGRRFDRLNMTNLRKLFAIDWALL